ncbi:MAG: hypothetical protein ABFD69_09140 [Candidatus Sumerlaeia bacterium]
MVNQPAKTRRAEVGIDFIMAFLIGVLIAIEFGMYGAKHSGWTGAVAGGVIGFLGGFFFGYIAWMLFTSVLEILTDPIYRMMERRRFKKFFGTYGDSAHAEMWNALKEKILVGDDVTGKVIDQIYYGVFLDIGAGFPARLTRSDSNDSIRDNQPPIGETVSACIKDYDDRTRMIHLRQKQDRIDFSIELHRFSL